MSEMQFQIASLMAALRSDPEITNQFNMPSLDAPGFGVGLLAALPVGTEMPRSEILNRAQGISGNTIDRVLARLVVQGILQRVGRGSILRVSEAAYSPAEVTPHPNSRRNLVSPTPPPQNGMLTNRGRRATQLCPCTTCGAVVLQRCVYPSGKTLPAHNARMALFATLYPEESALYT